MRWPDPATLTLLGAIGALAVALGRAVVVGIRLAAEQPFAIIKGLREQLAAEIESRERLQRELAQVRAGSVREYVVRYQAEGDGARWRCTVRDEEGRSVCVVNLEAED